VIKPAAGYRGPLAYSSPEAVQTTGTVAEYSHHGEVSKGDKVSLSAPLCNSYNVANNKSITSVDILVTGLTTDDAAKDGDIKFYLDGNPS
jgi:hypothetical protein